MRQWVDPFGVWHRDNAFYRTPADDEEWEDFEFMLQGYAYRSLQ